MTFHHNTTGWQLLGWALVLCQFALFILLAWPWEPPGMSVAGVVLAASGLLVGLWTLRHNQPGNFNVHPAPKSDGQLVTSGPYQYIRHPMYSAVLLVAAAPVFFYHAEVSKIASWLSLLLVLWLKTLLEEQALRHTYPDYQDCTKRTGRFIPRLF